MSLLKSLRREEDKHRLGSNEFFRHFRRRTVFVEKERSDTVAGDWEAVSQLR